MEQERLINQTQQEKKTKRLNRDEARDIFTEHVREIMHQANSDQEFQELLELHGIAVEYKPANIVLTNPETGLHHRIKTIDLQNDYEQMLLRGKGSSTDIQEPSTQKNKKQESESDSDLEL